MSSNQLATRTEVPLVPNWVPQTETGIVSQLLDEAGIKLRLNQKTIFPDGSAPYPIISTAEIVATYSPNRELAREIVDKAMTLTTREDAGKFLIYIGANTAEKSKADGEIKLNNRALIDLLVQYPRKVAGRVCREYPNNSKWFPLPGDLKPLLDRAAQPIRCIANALNKEESPPPRSFPKDKYTSEERAQHVAAMRKKYNRPAPNGDGRVIEPMTDEEKARFDRMDQAAREKNIKAAAKKKSTFKQVGEVTR